MLDSYLARIGLAAPPPCDADGLAHLHRSHYLNVPYENLGILLGRSFCLDQDALMEKLIGRGVGGYCYELNISFYRLLLNLGFKVDLVSARILQADGNLGPEYDHAAMIVHLEERWLVDVGNSKWFFEPIRLDTRAVQAQVGRRFQVEPADDEFDLMEFDSSGTPKLRYRVGAVARDPSEFEPLCQWKWTSPDSKFTRGLILSKFCEEGRFVVTGMRSIVLAHDGSRIDHDFADFEERRQVVRDHFGDAIHDQLKALGDSGPSITPFPV
ncbi:arylamine N-acetyltransferase family protein [Fimbriimonas ginsengisoli]|uniref:N-acetyltransferase n=1 Tax=Fimbriimonas ginsengisoli Gsoil 348 TaxID=661478 RepID=A0A068NX36_FIMGI|nr:arylamine N-acetyltransferase [Fimbriimonas ginsengisoli]AIE88001.1 N-acetyltransferase [Fimbriimonas ginsengisoli Gsoil 348]